MKTLPKVIGLVQAKNEWPLLAVSISHALMHHVDEVYVLNHESTDGSYEGLQYLQKLWKNRIHIVNWYDEHYWQEASINALIVLSHASSPDWIYIFDADEFLLTDGHRTLKEILSNTSAAHLAVRYEVQNWISMEDFDEDNLDHYRTMRYRSAPNLFIDVDPTICADEIFNGNLNFFDVPFPSKIIFRANAASWPTAGSHSLKSAANVRTNNIVSEELRCAHFPLLSRRKLERKVKHGQRLIRDGFPAIHGWQNQMIYKFWKENRLDEFWRTHSVSSRRDDSKDGTAPCSVVEDGFARAIEPTLRLLTSELESSMFRSGTKPDSSTRRLEDTPIPFGTVVRLTRSFQLAADSMCSERDAAIAERDAITNSLSWRCTAFIRKILRHARTSIESVKK